MRIVHKNLNILYCFIIDIPSFWALSVSVRAPFKMSVECPRYLPGIVFGSKRNFTFGCDPNKARFLETVSDS